MIGSAPVFSVSDFVSSFNQTLDLAYPEVVIVGELSSFRISKNVWVYSDLKDDFSSIKLFGSVRALPGPLEDGMLVEVVGRPYLHQQFGFSIQISGMRAVGKGSLNRAFELLKSQLQKEGLFEASRKRPIGFAPQKIALIASIESAGYGDFIKVVENRWPFVSIDVYDVLVQGLEAPQQLVDAITAVNKEGTPYEAIVVVRGGGSRDDLAAFDHEAVVRAVAASRIPTIVSVGHERDVTLAELAADLRASTPSNAAELLVPDRVAERASTQHYSQAFDSHIRRFSDQLKGEIDVYSRTLQHAMSTITKREVATVEHLKTLYRAYDPRMPLARGFVLARTNSGKVIRSTQQAIEARDFAIQFNDGEIEVTINSKDS